MKSVVIIGAGPGGLVAAKTLLHSQPGAFDVTILEKADRLGGLWPVDADRNDRKLNSSMPTNLSKYTVSFSDLSWDSVDISNSCENSTNLKEEVPMFPKAWQVGKYLNTYANKYFLKNVIKLNSTVINAQPIEYQGQMKWKLTWETLSPPSRDTNSELPKDSPKPLQQQQTFDFMIVASGFFNRPNKSKIQISKDNRSHTPHKQPINVIHSSNFHSITDLIPAHQDLGTLPKCIVVGGSLSGSEAAALLASDITSARYSPGSMENYLGMEVLHITARPFYIIPPIISQTSKHTLENPQKRFPSLSFAPVDMCMNDLSRRPPGLISFSWGKLPSEKAKIIHESLCSTIGDDQAKLSSVLLNEPTTRAPYIAFSENYAEFVRSGTIIPVAGRFIDASYQKRKDSNSVEEDNVLEAVISNGNQTTTIVNVVGIVDATGYSPLPALSFLPLDVKMALDFDEDSNRLPLLLLQDHYTWHHNFPTLGFIGFYEGPYWGVMEMQARLLTRRWASHNPTDFIITPMPDEVEELEKKRVKLQELRNAMHKKMNEVPQFWMGDYLGLMETFARDLGIQRDDHGWEIEQTGPIFPARYLDDSCDKTEALKTLKDLQKMLNESRTRGRFVARAAFRALHGSWKIHRELNSSIPTFPSGTFSGTANFHPRNPTDDKFDAEFLYIEKGVFTANNNGLEMNASRRYVYRFNQIQDRVSVWFVKEDGVTVDYLFLELHFKTGELSSHPNGWLAEGHHLCIQDMYNTLYDFHFHGVSLETFGIKHSVQGPRKDYISNAWYER